MYNWRFIMNLAESAKRKMIDNKEEGESDFINLLNRFGDDGMIYFKRAEAYEQLGYLEFAANDYEKAKHLFPMKTWIQAASNSLWRTKNKND